MIQAIHANMLAAWLLAAVPTLAIAGPFGVDEGMSASSLPEATEFSRWMYSFKPEKAHRLFAEHFVSATPQHGVCLVGAVGHPQQNDRFGEKVRNLFLDIRAQLTAIYGPPTKEVDILKPGSIYRDPNDWVAAVKHNERLYEAVWGNETTVLKDKIVQIWLRVDARLHDESKLFIRYTFSNIAGCRKENTEAEKGAL